MNNLIVSLTIALILTTGVFGQSASAKKPSRTIQTTNQAQVNDADAVPVVKDAAIYVNYESDETASLEVKTASESGRFTKGQLNSFLQGFSKVPTTKISTKNISQSNLVYVFKPDLSLTLGAIVDTIRSVRSSITNNVMLDLNDGLTFYIRGKTDANKVVRPNPLTLTVNVDNKKKITLNGEDEGKLPNLSKLKGHLSEIFKSRIENGVFREGSDTVDTTVNLVVPDSIKFEIIQELGLAISSAGADRIFLVLDPLDIVRSSSIQSIEATPINR